MKQLESETVMWVNCENKIRTLEELEFKAEVHKQEISEAGKRAQQNIALNMNLQQECEDLKGTVEEIRLEKEASAQRMHYETEAAYERKMNELQSVVDENVHVIEKREAELRSAREQVDRMTAECLQSQTQASEQKLVELETKLRNYCCVHDSATAWRDTELQRLKATVSDQLHEYCDLMDVKIKLDSQIASYQKLLACEEKRMTPTRTKRKAVAEEHTTDCEVTSTVKYAITIQTTDVNGNFVIVGKAMNFKLCMLIYRLDRNKSPLKTLGKLAMGIVTSHGLPKIFKVTIYWANCTQILSQR